MKRCLSIACLLMLVASSVAGAATKGANELLFGFSGLNSLGLNTYEGGIGVRHWLSENTAIRPTVNLGFGSQTTKGVSGMSDDKTTSNLLGLTVAYEKHMGGSETISPYLGASVGFSTNSTKNEPSHLASPANGTTLSVKDSGMNFGVAGLAGFQWFFAKNISLDGEYQLGLVSQSVKQETVQVQETTTQKRSGFSLGLGTATLAISVAL